jgi:hypothetical protein
MNRKDVTNFTPGPPVRTQEAPPVFVPPSVNPNVAAYQAGIAARRTRPGASPPKYNAPVSGGEAPPIPLLTAQHRIGATMAEQAEGVNTPPQHVQVQQALAANPNAILQSGGVSPFTSPAVQTPQLSLQPGDLLPQEAMKDPEFMGGPGSMNAHAQPGLALRYGVMRGGQRLMPQQLYTQTPGQRTLPRGEQSIREFNEFMRLQNQQGPDGLPRTDQEAEERAEEETSHLSAAKIGTTPELTPEQRKEIEEKISGLDAFDFAAIRDQMVRDIINNPDQRKIIEGGLKELDIDELIMKNRTYQRVPIIDGRFEITFVSMTGEDDLALKRLLMLESKSVEVTERYLTDKFAFMALTVGLHAINNNPVPAHTNDKGEFDEKLFWTKFVWVMKKPLHMLASIHANHIWFEQRVRKLFVAKKVGNG